MSEPKEPNGDFYPLDDVAIAFFSDGIKEIERINQHMYGALQFYIKQHKLQGFWKLAENGKEIERIAPPVPAPQ